MVRSTSLFLASVALALGVVTASDVHVHVRTHHHHPPTDSRKVFQITGSKAAFDQFLTPSVQKELQFDVWRIARVDDNQVQADTVATDNAMTRFRAKMTTTTHGQKKTHNKHTNLKVENKEDDVQQRIHKDTIDVQNCHRATKWQGKELKSVDKYTKSLYFNCFRAYEEIDEFFSTVTELNPQIVTKITNISTTFDGLGIDAYKLSTSKVQPRRLADQTPEKKSVYTQSLIHAREWQAGAATHFTFASLLDDLRAGDANTLDLFEDVDWYFVPLVNIDGYKITWDTDRYWRINSHEANGYEGIDLNRNFPPHEYFNLEPALVEPETYPGVKPLSEPETKGLYKFVMDLPNLIGLVDMHSYGGMVLRPFSDVQTEPEEPYGSAMKKLGDGVRDAMSPQGQFQYKSDPSAVLYPAYGCFDDAVYRATNYSVAVLTIEVEGNDFTAPQETIRKVGQDVNNGLRRFVEEAQEYHELVEDVADAK